MSNKFEHLTDIPDLVPKGLLIPDDVPELMVPKRVSHSRDTTTPLEVSYCFMHNYAGGFMVERQGLVDSWLQQVQNDPIAVRKEVVKYLMSRGRHLARAMIRASLDPDRMAPISMVDVYNNERKGYPNPGEEYFFEHFIDYHGVLVRRPDS